jgi:hypothetical protein
MVLNPGIPTKKSGHFRLIAFFVFIFIIVFSILLFRTYQLREITIVEKYINNESAILIIQNNLTSSARSSAESSSDSHYNQLISVMSSSVVSSSLDSLIKNLLNVSAESQISLIQTTTQPTTTLSFDYTSYSIKVPMKFKYCNPNTDTCIPINSSCCPCSTIGIVDSVKKEIAWGGKIDAINSKYYDIYFNTYLHNCTGFGVKCLMASTGSGCNWNAECLGGVCKLVSRF